MSGISYRTYQRLGSGVRYYNMNLGHRATGLDTLPSLNPFSGVTHTDIDESTIHEIESKLEAVSQVFEAAPTEELAEACDVSVQNIIYAQEGVDKASSAVSEARVELDC